MGFEQFLRYAENMTRVVRSDLRLGATLGFVRQEEVELLVSKYDKLEQSIRYILRELELCRHKPVG